MKSARLFLVFGFFFCMEKLLINLHIPTDKENSFHFSFKFCVPTLKCQAFNTAGIKISLLIKTKKLIKKKGIENFVKINIM